MRNAAVVSGLFAFAAVAGSAGAQQAGSVGGAFNPAAVLVGGSAQLTITVTSPNAISVAVVIQDTTSVPVSFAPDANTAPSPGALSINVPMSLAPGQGTVGKATVLVSAPDGTGGPHSITLTAAGAPQATVVLAVQDFTLSAPAVPPLEQGLNYTFNVVIGSVGGLTGSVSLSTAQAPPVGQGTISTSFRDGTQAADVPVPSQSLVFVYGYVRGGGSAIPGSYSVTITGTLDGTSLTRSVTISVQVSPHLGATTTVTAPFTMSGPILPGQGTIPLVLAFPAASSVTNGPPPSAGTGFILVTLVNTGTARLDLDLGVTAVAVARGETATFLVPAAIFSANGARLSCEESVGQTLAGSFKFAATLQ